MMPTLTSRRITASPWGCAPDPSALGSLALDACQRHAWDVHVAKVAETRFDEVRVLRQIPVDRRHNAKIDYPALYRLLGVI